MISIECHRSGERCPGKREFDNRIDINRVRSGEIDVAIPFKPPKPPLPTRLIKLGPTFSSLPVGLHTNDSRHFDSERDVTKWDIAQCLRSTSITCVD